ncbi:hypothetical protein B0J17DRAFT_51134 [Rhizoctonia solani]|nr:hypothetical protein B0J17DRAFT_51134 [Rhizoctonia solani]
MNPVVEVRVEAGERVMQRWFIGAAFVLTFASLLGTLVVAPPLVKPVDRCESSRDTRNYRCDVDSAVLSTAALVHLSHETERRNLIQNTTSRPAIKDPLPQLYLIVALSVLAHSESIGGASNLVLGLVVWRMPLFTSNNMVSTILQPHTRVSRRTMFSIDMVYRTRATESSGQLFTKRRTPLLGWHPVDGGREISPSYMRGPTRTGAHSLPPTILYSFNQLYAQPTSLNPYLNLRTLVLSKQPSVLLPEEVRLGVAPHHRLCIEWHAPVPAVEQPANISDKEIEDAQSLLCQYESYRPPDLGKYPPEERTRVQNREIRLAQKLQERRKRKDAKEGKVKVKPEPPAWMAVWMEMMKHGCIPAGKERSGEWALRSILRWEGAKELKGGRARKKVMWADEV